MNPSEEATTTWSSSEPEDGSSSPMALLTTTLSSLMEAAMNESGYDVSTTGMPPVPIDPPIGKCNYYVKNSTVVVIDFTNQYGGIPQNLVFNLIGWFLLVLAFAFLRRTAGNYGR